MPTLPAQFQRAVINPSDHEARSFVETEYRSAIDRGEVSPPTPPTELPTWSNWAGNQRLFAPVEHPKTRAELVELVKQASTAPVRRIKAVGPGHSFSDIVQTDGLVVDVTRLLEGNDTGLIDREDDLWKDPYPAEEFVRVPSGASIRLLNKTLDQSGLAFRNLGGYDVQCVISAASTSTHGSGIGLGPLDTEIFSLDLVTTDGKVYRIEPEDGITDPGKFRRRYAPEEIELIQDDRWFRSVAVSMGTMGIIHSAVIRVASSYLIRETRTGSTWREVKRMLKQGLFREHRHVEIIVHPYAGTDGDHRCVVFRRDVAPANAHESPDEVIRNALSWFATRPMSRDLLLFMIRRHPELVPWLLDRALDSLISDQPFIAKSWRIFNIGAPNNFKALSAEYGFGFDQAHAAIDRLLEVMAENHTKGWFQTSPVSIRFVKKSFAHLSMMSGRDTVMLETPILRGTPGIEESLESYEDAARTFGGRPHWGQMHTLTGMPGWLTTNYPGFEAWLETFMTLNHKGIFNNAFTDRIGISKLVSR